MCRDGGTRQALPLGKQLEKLVSSSTKCLIVQFGRVSSRTCTRVEEKENVGRREAKGEERDREQWPRGRGAASGQGGARALAHLRQDVDEVVQAGEVAVLPVPLLPGDVVLQGLALGQGRGFPKVDHPHLGLFLLVVDEEERAADDLQGSEEVRRGPLEPLPCPLYCHLAPRRTWGSLRPG